MMLLASSAMGDWTKESQIHHEMRKEEAKKAMRNIYDPHTIFNKKHKYIVRKSGDERILDKGTVACFLGEFYCQSYDRYCVSMYLNEVNSWKVGHDTLSYHKIHCTSYHRMMYRICGVFKMDADWFDDVYESGIEVYHNCSSDGRTMKFNRRLQDVRKKGLGFQQFENNFHLYDLGDPVYKVRHALRYWKGNNQDKDFYTPISSESEGNIPIILNERQFYTNELTNIEKLGLLFTNYRVDFY